jgi:hypothetical protein
MQVTIPLSQPGAFEGVEGVGASSAHAQITIIKLETAKARSIVRR